MIRGLYSAATALESSSQRQEVTSYNLAHATTPGFRAKGLINESFDRVLNRVVDGEGDILGTQVTGGYTNFTPGGIKYTKNPFDLAIENDGFFVLNTPQGQVYTRNGSFRLTSNGNLVSASGYPVEGVGGPVTLPPAADYSIGQDGSITADGNVVGRIAMVRFAKAAALQNVGPTLFQAPRDAGLQQSDVGMIQGAQESSNVSPAQSMIEMITHQRYFEAAQRALRALGDSIQLNTRPQ
jgi:flagellar basal-body rod protein FlgF